MIGMRKMDKNKKQREKSLPWKHWSKKKRPSIVGSPEHLRMNCRNSTKLIYHCLDSKQKHKAHLIINPSRKVKKIKDLRLHFI